MVLLHFCYKCKVVTDNSKLICDFLSKIYQTLRPKMQLVSKITWPSLGAGQMPYPWKFINYLCNFKFTENSGPNPTELEGTMVLPAVIIMGEAPLEFMSHLKR